MKAIVFALISLFVSASFARSTTAPTIGENIAGVVIEVTPLCPANVFCVTDGSIVKLSFEMQNSCQELLSFQYQDIGNGVIEVEAVRGLNPNFPADPLFVPVCAQSIEQREVTMSLVEVYPPFQIRFKGTPAVVDVTEYSF